VPHSSLPNTLLIDFENGICVGSKPDFWRLARPRLLAQIVSLTSGLNRAIEQQNGPSCWKVVALETRKLSCKCPAVGCMAAQLSVRQREG
jgi:hypothetical protein